eukprot:CAMPEP_0170242902 /NCGR_PEP_ID=MMETSP0116_2-20130129/21224_1 /TAXON_ID=400756 /ORGANISM="Durinskia baltica, Strain CSIRO CS-38" /LENGTH=93 /DNA_ID=CAMNT_0010493751 /DNA_START=84 /DNA_END=362 /DNA_ORIENTATION=+
MISVRALGSALGRLPALRGFASESAIVSKLQGRIKDLADKKTPQFTRLRKELGDVAIGQVTVGACIGGARGIKCLLSETSLLDPMEGIRYRGM